MRRHLLIGGALAALALLALGAAFAMSTWDDVNRVDIDRVVAESADTRGGGDGDGLQSSQGDGQVTADLPGDGLDVFVLVGSDSREDLESTDGFGDFEGQRADVVMVLLRQGSKAALLSLPRDLLVEDVCRPGRRHKLNEALQGCAGGVNGPTALILTVESVIGRRVDHFALVDLAGFPESVDAAGGYEICVERPVRDTKADLELPAGCTHASGAETLAWLRSRSTQELTDSGWRSMPGVNDLTRNQRQRDFLLDMMARLSDFSSPAEMAEVARAIAPHVTVDSGLTLFQAIDLAWAMRGLGGGAIDEIEIDYADATTEAGAAVLVPQQDIADLVEAYLGPETAGELLGAMPTS